MTNAADKISAALTFCQCGPAFLPPCVNACERPRESARGRSFVADARSGVVRVLELRGGGGEVLRRAFGDAEAAVCELGGVGGAERVGLRAATERLRGRRQTPARRLDLLLADEDSVNHQRDADAGGDDAALDLVIALHLRRDAAQALKLLQAFFALGLGEKHLRHPGLAPVELLALLARVKRQAHGLKVRAAVLAEPQLVGLICAALRTDHSSPPSRVFTEHAPPSSQGIRRARARCSPAAPREVRQP